MWSYIQVQFSPLGTSFAWFSLIAINPPVVWYHYFRTLGQYESVLRRVWRVNTLPRVTAESKCNQSYAYMQIHINLTSWNSSREGNQWALWVFSRQGNYPSQLLVYNKFQNTNIYAHTYTHITSYTNSLPSYWILWYKESLLWRMWGMRVYTTLPREAPSYQMHVLLNPSNFHRNHITLKTKTLHYTATDESGVQKMWCIPTIKCDSHWPFGVNLDNTVRKLPRQTLLSRSSIVW